MKRAKRPVVASVLASTLVLGAMTPLATHARSMGDVDNRPGEVAMIGDALIARPVLAASTVVGFVLYTVTLPVSLLGGNEDEAAEKLVRAPARSTFLRCLGCTPAQHDQLVAEKRTKEAQENK